MYTQTKWYLEGKEEGFKIGKLKSTKYNLISYISFKTELSILHVARELKVQLNSINLDNNLEMFKAVISLKSSNLEEFKSVLDKWS